MCIVVINIINYIHFRSHIIAYSFPLKPQSMFCVHPSLLCPVSDWPCGHSWPCDPALLLRSLGSSLSTVALLACPQVQPSPTCWSMPSQYTPISQPHRISLFLSHCSQGVPFPASAWGQRFWFWKFLESFFSVDFQWNPIPHTEDQLLFFFSLLFFWIFISFQTYTKKQE